MPAVYSVLSGFVADRRLTSEPGKSRSGRGARHAIAYRSHTRNGKLASPATRNVPAGLACQTDKNSVEAVRTVSNQEGPPGDGFPFWGWGLA